MQIFIKRTLVDEIAYAALPFGAVDNSRQPLSKWLNSNEAFNFGQVRLVVNPKIFMQRDCVKMYVASADPTYHASRESFQNELTRLIDDTFADRSLRESATRDISGGTLPEWWVRKKRMGSKRTNSCRCQ